MRCIALSVALAGLTACSASSDPCGASGDWVRVHQARANNVADALVSNGDGAPPSRFVFSSEVHTFTQDGLVIGGRDDGLQMQGWLATNWECEGGERIVLSAAGGGPIGPLAERVQLLAPDLLQIPSGGFGADKQFVRYDGSKEAAADNLSEAIEYLRENSVQ